MINQSPLKEGQAGLLAAVVQLLAPASQYTAQLPSLVARW